MKTLTNSYTKHNKTYKNSRFLFAPLLHLLSKKKSPKVLTLNIKRLWNYIQKYKHYNDLIGWRFSTNLIG